MTVGIGQLYGQTQSTDPLPDERIQDLLETIATQLEDADFDFETFQENLLNFLDEPLDLNSASRADLGDLGLLNGAQIDALLDHRYQYGSLLSIYELQLVPGMDGRTIANIKPFVTLESNGRRKLKAGDYLFGGRHRVYTRYQTILEDQKGYTQPDSVRNYLGNRARLYMRYRYQQGNRLSYGFTAEKDPGEEFFGGTQPRGFDYYSAHLYFRDLGVVKDLALGDYQILLGQGLAWWSGFGFGKSAYVLDVRKNARTISPYTSVNENLFLRGAAATFRLGKEEGIGDHLSLTAWGSHKAIDANQVDSDTLFDGAGDAVTSFVEDGFHRTETELEKKDAAKESIGGISMTYTKRNWRVGIAASHLRYNVSLDQADRPDNRFNFEGDRLSNATAFYSANVRNLSFFGETALSDNGSMATLNGLQANLHPRVEMAAVYRYYDKAYQAMYANVFAEQSTVGNEQGIYLGLTYRVARKISLDAYVDLYRHPWLRFRADAPSRGRDFLAQVTWKPSRRTEFYVRAKHEVKQENAVNNETAIDFLVPVRRTNLRFNLSSNPSSVWRLRSRVELSWFDNSIEGLERGVLVYQDLQWSPRRIPLTLTARYALFDAESFDARIYAYESDVLYQFSIPFFNDRGSRYYILAKYKPARWINIYARFARTGFTNRETVGSDLEEIDAPHRSEFKGMLVFKF